MKKTPWFTRELFQFLVELQFNNDRSWFKAQQKRYEEHVKLPVKRFSEALQPLVVKLNKAYTYPKAFRIHRDTRFSKDKSPYKGHVAIQVRHRAAMDDVHAPGFYIHLDPGGSFAGSGIWMPEPDALKAVRTRIAKKDPAWLKLKRSRMPLYEGDELKRPPKGFDPEHPFIEDLKRRHFITWVDFTDKQVFAPDFLERVIAALKKTDPLVRFLCQAQGLKD